MDDANPSVLDEWCSHCGRSVHDEERAGKAMADATALQADTLRRAIGVAWGEGEIEDSDAATLFAAVSRVTRS